MKKWIIGLVAIPFGILVGVLFQPLISGDNIYQQVKKFNTVLSTANKNYVDEVDTQKLVEAALNGMLKELDPHSVYISAEDMKRVQEDFSGNFEGIGIEFDILQDTITVVSPIPGGPSDSLGILAGDKIVKIDGKDAIGIPRSDVPKKLKGPKGTIVEVDIKRAGEDGLLHYEIVRDKIPLNAVQTAFMLEDSDIGLVKVSKFSATTHSEMIETLTDLKKKGMKKLILDLRGNPGGYLTQAFLMADEFLPGGDTIVYTSGRKPEFYEVFKSTQRGLFHEIPLIVLIDAGSASASEIVSGAMQDLDRGLIVGVTSFGKGLVQRQYPLNDGSAFRLTISKYYTPSGRSIQRPYDDEKEYRSLAGRFDVEEGENIEHTFDKIRKEFEDNDKYDAKITDKYVIITEKPDDEDGELKLDSLEIFYTKSGRPVLGGGGITPDYVVKYDTVTKLRRQIWAKNIYTRFVDEYMRENGNKLRKQYEDNFKAFKTGFEITDEIMDKFKDFATDAEVEWSDEDYETNGEQIRTAVKANVARAIWERSKYYEIIYENDRIVNKSKGLFHEATKIAGLR